MAHMKQGVMKDLRPLPPGWQQHWSQEANKWYYVQMSTVPPRITYDHPLDLPHLAPPPPPPPPPLSYLESQYPQRPPSRGSISSGVSSLSSPSISSTRGSVVMSVERVPKNTARHLTPAQAISQAHSGATRRNTAVPSHQVPHPLPHPQPVHANALPGLPVGQRSQVSINQMARMPEPQPSGYVNPGGMYKLEYTGPVPGVPQSNPSMLSVSSNSTTMSETNGVAPLKEKKPKKRSFFGTSAMKDLREEHKTAVVATTTMPVGLPNMGTGGQVQTGAMNTMAPGQVPVLQQNTTFGIQGGISMNGQMGMQNQAPISPGQVPVLQQNTTFGMQGGVPMNGQMGMQNQTSISPGQVPVLQQNTAFGMQGGVPMNGQMGMQNQTPISPGQVSVLQQNTAFGMQGGFPTNMQMGIQNRPSIQGGIDLSKVTNVAKSALSSALYMTTGITSQDLTKLGSRIKVAFSGVPLNEIGINARELEAVLVGQPGANYQGVINALMIQQQREHILMLQTGRPSSKVNYQDLINQVRKMQDIANNKMQQMMAMNAGMGGMQMGMNGMAGVQGQGAMAQQSAMIQQQILMEQQKLAQMQQMQMSMGQVPGQMQVPMVQAPAQMQMAMGQVPAQMQVPMGQVPAQMQMSTVQHPMMMDQQQIGLQTQPAGVARPAVQSRSMGMQPGRQVIRPGTTTQVKKKEKPLPVAPEGKKKKKIQQTRAAPTAVPLTPEGKKKSVQQTRALPTAVPVAPVGKKKRSQQTQVKPTATRPNLGRENRTGRVSVGPAPQVGKVQGQGMQQQAGVVARGRGGQRGSQRGGNQRQLGHGARGQPGQVVQGGDNEPSDLYLFTAQQGADDDDDDGDSDDEDEDGDDDDEEGEEVDVDIDVTVYEDDNDEDDEEEDVDVDIDVAVYEDDEEEDDEEEPEDEEIEVDVDVTVYEEEEVVLVEEDDNYVDVADYEVADPGVEYQVYEVDPCTQYQVYDVDQGGGSGGDSGGFDLSASFGDVNLDVSYDS